MSTVTPNTWCVPQHHNPEGLTDPSTTTLPQGFSVTILGASSGIGAGVARSYAKAGAEILILSSRSQAKLDTIKAELQGTAKNEKVQIHTRVCDVTSGSDIQGLASFAREVTKGRLDVVVYNAGTAGGFIRRENGLRDFPFGLVELGTENFRKVMEMNVMGLWNTAVHFLPMLEEHADGAQAFVVTSSAASHYVDAGLMSAAYSLSKFAATRVVEHIMEGHGRKGVVAFAVQPGGVKTDMAQQVPEGKGWEALLIDHIELMGGFVVWLTKEKKDWLSGRYLDARWDVEELIGRRERIVEGDLLKFRLNM